MVTAQRFSFLHCLGQKEVFLGSCTNSRYEDLKVAADIIAGEKVARVCACCSYQPPGLNT